MNRMEEYYAFQAGLLEVPEGDPVGKAVKRLRRRNAVLRPLVTVAAVLCVFTGMINLSPAVAAACREIPLLAELTELLIVRPSLQTAVEHGYIQLIGESQTENGVTATVEHIIVDQKQVNIFYRVSWDRETDPGVRFRVRNVDGTETGSFVLGSQTLGSELNTVTVDYEEKTVPDRLLLTLQVYDTFRKDGVAVDERADPEDPEYLAELTFELAFDPQYTEQGRTVSLNKPFTLNGQQFAVTELEIYPSHIRLRLKEEKTNTLWLKKLRFYLELENGRQVHTVANGITATGQAETESFLSYRAESSHFENADCIRLVITGADWSVKDQKPVKIDLKTGESDPLPEGGVLQSVKDCKLSFVIDDDVRSGLLLEAAYDGAGKRCEFRSITVDTPAMDENVVSLEGWTGECYTIEGLTGDAVWVRLRTDDQFEPDTPVIVELQ